MKNVKRLGILCFIIIVNLASLAGCTNQIGSNPAPTPQATRDPMLEKSIETQLEAINPEAVEIYRDATASMDAGDYQNSKDLYSQVITLAPDFSPAYRRLGYIEARLNNPDAAIQLTRKAVWLEPNGYNKSSLAWTLLFFGEEKDFQEAYVQAKSAVSLLPEDETAIATWLLASAFTNNITDLRQADEQLLHIAPSNLYAHYYAGLIAATDGKWEKAEKEFILSRKLGVPAEAIQQVLNSGISRNAMINRLLKGGGIATGFWLLGLGIFFVVGKNLSSATIKNLKNAQLPLDVRIQARELRTRSIYRKLISFLSIYYYLSMPFVIILLFLVVGIAVYIIGRIGVIPVYAIWILVIMLFGSLYAILRSVLLRPKDAPPGRQLQRMDAPELWSLVEDVARRLSVRPVDSIYLTNGTGISVNEKGSMLRKLQGAGKRNLLLGMGDLLILNQGQLAALLAHEYGHFSNRDTAGGDLAHQVYASLLGMIQRLVQIKAAYFFNPVWLFVVVYQRLFLRVTQGASRLQEILADRYAVRAYGSSNFIEGLQHLIRQNIAFPMLVNNEIGAAIENKQPLVNLYKSPMMEEFSEDVEKQFQAVMQRTTSEYDSHPAPKERITWIEELHLPDSQINDNPRPALHLLPNVEQLQRELTQQINSSLRL